jgi:hypothetical protein
MSLNNIKKHAIIDVYYNKRRKIVNNRDWAAGAACFLNTLSTLVALGTCVVAATELSKKQIAHQRPGEVVGAVGVAIAFAGMAAAAACILPKDKPWRKASLALAAILAALAGPANLIWQNPLTNNLLLGITAIAFANLYPGRMPKVGQALIGSVVITTTLELASSDVAKAMSRHPEGAAFNDALLPAGFAFIAAAHLAMEWAKTGAEASRLNIGLAIGALTLIAGACVTSFASVLSSDVPAPLILAFMAAATVCFAAGGLDKLWGKFVRGNNDGVRDPLLPVVVFAPALGVAPDTVGSDADAVHTPDALA